MTDAATERARERSRLGYTRERNVLRTKHIPRTTSGSRGVSIDDRSAILEHAIQLNVGAASRKYDVSQKSIYRWMERLDPIQMTGNRERVILTGFDQYLLTMCIYLHPRARADQQAAFILENGGAAAYSRQDISCRLKELKVTRKLCHLESYSAFTPRNVLRAKLFFTRGPRIGVLGVPWFRLTDTDEAKFTLIKVESKRGLSYTTHRSRDAGYFKRCEGGGVNL